jgi:hypothetical protein
MRTVSQRRKLTTARSRHAESSTDALKDHPAWLHEIRLWAAAREDCLWVAFVENYRNCRVAGVVTRLTLDPRAGVIEATINDGFDALVAQWPLRARMPQLRAAPGSGLILEGVAEVDDRGRIVMREPKFEITSGPMESEQP